MSLSPTSQPLYGGGMASGASGYASPTVPSPSMPHEGMSTDKIVLITGGSLIAAVAIGTGIYYLSKKEKSSDKKISAPSNATQRRGGNNHNMSQNMNSFYNSYKANHIPDSYRSFKQLSQQEKNKFIMDELINVNNSDQLELAKRMFFVFCDGNLSNDIDQAFNNKAKSLNYDADEINFKQEISDLKSSSEDERLSSLSHWIAELKLDNSSGPLSRQSKDILELYYDKFLRPEISQETHKKISKLAAEELHIHFR